jgi:hypothetical protein
MARQPRYIEFIDRDPTTILTTQRHPKGGIWTFDDLKSSPIPGLPRRAQK